MSRYNMVMGRDCAKVDNETGTCVSRENSISKKSREQRLGQVDNAPITMLTLW